MKKLTAMLAALVMCTGLTACENEAETYTNYIQSVLDCTYRAEYDVYMKMTDSEQEEAEEVYQSQVDYVKELICYQNAVEIDYLSEETMDSYEELAIKLMDKLKYTVEPAVKSGDSYHITVNCEPIDFWDATYDEIIAFYDDGFSERYENAADEDERTALEEEYAAEVLKISEAALENPTYGEVQTKIVEITLDEDGLYGISDDDWVEIDDKLLNLSY
jgi:hypothetical protein